MDDRRRLGCYLARLRGGVRAVDGNPGVADVDAGHAAGLVDVAGDGRCWHSWRQHVILVVDEKREREMSELGAAAELNGLFEQIEVLKAQAGQIIAERREQAIADIRTMIEAFGLGPEEIGMQMPTQPKPSMARRRKSERQPARYRDPSSGRTWSGRGRIPLWVQAAEKDGQSRAEFLIQAETQDLRVAA